MEGSSMGGSRPLAGTFSAFGSSHASSLRRDWRSEIDPGIDESGSVTDSIHIQELNWKAGLRSKEPRLLSDRDRWHNRGPAITRDVYTQHYPGAGIPTYGIMPPREPVYAAEAYYSFALPTPRMTPRRVSLDPLQEGGMTPRTPAAASGLGGGHLPALRPSTESRGYRLEAVAPEKGGRVSFQEKTSNMGTPRRLAGSLENHTRARQERLARYEHRRHEYMMRCS
eukprot:TRINITY_DN4571_c0_g1_i4.p1 TRINITY_DN4571_c0_g1~~TRINITY_DN4571_c0_g1_i4.p1  ORF type:complete len:225 (-),score=26.23 TRINITY_DN4571_c0_g1_i4:57-731(-)